MLVQTLSCVMRDLVPWPGIKPRHWDCSLSHWATRELPIHFFEHVSGTVLGTRDTGMNKISLIQLSRSVMSNSLPHHGLQHARLPCPSPALRVYSNSCPLIQWCHPIISFSVVPFSSCLQPFPASGSFQMSHFFTSSGKSIGVSASTSVLLMNIQDWFPLGWTGWISLQSKGLLRVFSNTIVQKHQFFCAQLFL